MQEGLNPVPGTAYNESTPNTAEGLTVGESLTEGKDYAAAGEMPGERAEGAGGAEKTVEVNGKTVTMNNEIFNPNLVDRQGRTNVQRMGQGLSPIGTDGKSVNIHHMDQTDTGSLMEITATKHQQNYTELHMNTGQSPSQINRNIFNSWRKDYWKWRGDNLK